MSKPELPPAMSKQDAQWMRARLQVQAQFTPAAPIDRASLFAGRKTQIRSLIEAIAEPGRHAVLFGERGVGKTSLGNIFHELVGGTFPKMVMPIRKQASPSDDYSTLWRKVFRDLTYEIRRKGDYGNDEVESRSISDLYENDIIPDDVVREIKRFSAQRVPVIIFDEFDKLTDLKSKGLMSHTIKAMSDGGIRATIIIIGVASDINTLVKEHASITRNLTEIKMPRMSKEELNEILDERLPKAGLTIEGDARWKIVLLSRGLPEYVHSLGKASALRAVDARRTKISEADVTEAIKDVISQTDQTSSNEYRTAIASNNKNALYKTTLLACALTRADDDGTFAAKDVLEPYSNLLGKKCEISNFQDHLKVFSEDERGNILVRHGKSRMFRYSFREPKMQPYVIMQGMASGDVSEDGLAVLSAPEQPRLSNEF